MIKIEDIFPKDYKKLFRDFNFKKEKYLNPLEITKFISILTFFVMSINTVAAPLSIPSFKALNEEVQKRKESLEAELQKVLKEIENYKNIISDIQKQKRTIQNDIKMVEAQIKKLELEIKVISLNIKKLNERIAQTKKSIQITEDKIARSREILTAALRYYYQMRQRNIVEVFLAQARLSDYFDDFFYIQRLQEQINTEIDNLKELNKKLNSQKVNLENELEEQTNLLSLQQLKRKELKDLKVQQQILLAQKNKEESEYKKLLEKSQKTAAEIREQIYRLAGGVGPITFGEAYELAKIAEKYTNIRPAFLLAVLHYESKLGQNVGNCHYKDAMKPSERPIFENIVQELGLDPNRMPVSCKQWYGWGGAMGPAQFLPSTWMKYRDRVSQITGNNPPSPWNNLDAFTAAALYLTSVGADARTYQAEWKAAMIYFAGSNWNKPSLRFYGDDVMAIAQRFQNDIDVLEGRK
jgi:membrane-bound lytic murein transglycosylase B